MLISRLKLPTQLGASNIRTRAREIASATQILPQLFLSDYSTALDTKELSRLGITHVVSVVGFEPGIPDSIPVLGLDSQDAKRTTLKKLHIRLEDAPEANLLRHLEETTTWIRQVYRSTAFKALAVAQPSFVRTSSLLPLVLKPCALLKPSSLFAQNALSSNQIRGLGNNWSSLRRGLLGEGGLASETVIRMVRRQRKQVVGLSVRGLESVSGTWDLEGNSMTMWVGHSRIRRARRVVIVPDDECSA